jgi:hypothetical protein
MLRTHAMRRFAFNQVLHTLSRLMCVKRAAFTSPKLTADARRYRACSAISDRDQPINESAVGSSSMVGPSGNANMNCAVDR